MKVRITVGPVDIRPDGLNITRRELRAMLRHAHTVAVDVIAAANSGDNTDSTDTTSAPIGFTAIIERAPDLPMEGLEDDE